MTVGGDMFFMIDSFGHGFIAIYTFPFLLFH